MRNYNQSEQESLVKWLKDEKDKTDLQFGEFQRNRITMENAGVLSKEDDEFFTYHTNRLRFRYRWLEEQIQSFNKVSDTIKDNMWYIDKHNLI